MKSFLNRCKNALLPTLAAMTLAGGAIAASSGNANQFSSIETLLTEWAEGSLGRVLAIAAFIIGLSMGIVRQSAMAVVIGITFALVLAFGPGVITSMLTFAV